MSTYTPIATQTLIASASSITFSNIPQDYTDLVIVVNNGNSVSDNTCMRFNADDGSNYSLTYLGGNGTTASSGRTTSATYIRLDSESWSTTGASSGIKVIHLMNYSNSSTYKTSLMRSANGSVGTSATVGLWRNTNPITSVTIYALSGQNVAGSTFSIYGIQAGTPKAQGGQIVTTDGTYWYHTFTASGTFTPSTALSCDYLVVAGGGGGGGSYYAGGGGAGGYKTTIGGSQLSVTANTYAVVIGAGGAGLASGIYGQGNSGSNSVFGSITSTGGGGGGGFTSYTGLNGGSGGGGGGNNGGGDISVGGSASPSGQGNNGGKGYFNTAGNESAGGGGGGAGAAGTALTSGSGYSNGGAGGVGLSNSISGTATYYAGGGGGGTGRSTETVGAGGNGGGGAGGKNGTAATAGTANTGGGGGGAGGYPQASASGGSGIVIIRYAV